MAENLKSRIRTKIFRRVSTAVPASGDAELGGVSPSADPQRQLHHKPLPTIDSRKESASVKSVKSIKRSLTAKSYKNSSESNKNDGHARPDTQEGSESLKSIGDLRTLESSLISFPSSAQSPAEGPSEIVISVQEATPGSLPAFTPQAKQQEPSSSSHSQQCGDTAKEKPTLATTDADVIKALLQDHPHPPPIPPRSPTERQGTAMPEIRAMNAEVQLGEVQRGRPVWVKRPGSTATRVIIGEGDIVDDAKDLILHRYANALGRHYDSPDVTLQIVTRGTLGERVLDPDEQLWQTLVKHYPGGQRYEEALIIDVPQRRTPRPSPRAMQHAMYYYPQKEDHRPHETSTDYFPQMPPQMPPVAAAMPSPMLTASSHESRHAHAAHERAMSVLNTGQVPLLPSPGGRRPHASKAHRPLTARHNTTSPNLLASSLPSRPNRPRLDSTASNEKHPPNAPSAPALPTPPIAEQGGPINILPNPPTPRVASPRPGKGRKTRQKQQQDGPSLPPSLTMLETAMPPINVLIVEDNIINMKLLEQFVRRLGVRWQTAVNGREAVNKWRQGGYHLVLMDIQLPIMSGLEATKEIRKLERVNSIGVFSSSSSASESPPEEPIAPDQDVTVKEEDRLNNVGKLFKSPVIIVALTASNLQSDRHEALAAGCNDFLTKPVNFVWFERKVKEWGCMQALIDFDGWRKWEDFATMNGLKDSKDPKTGPRASASKRGREPKTPTGPTMNSANAKENGLVDPSETKDFATLPQKSIGHTLNDDRLKKEDSPDTVVHVPGS